MLKICICDDDLSMIETVKKHLLMYSFMCGIDFEITTHCNPNQFLRDTNDYQIVFLDIHFADMPTGIDIAVELRRRGANFILVFISSYASYSIQGYEAEAFRYLLKPIRQDTLNSVMASCIKKLTVRNRVVSINSNYGKEYIDSKQIIYVDSLARKRNIVCEDDAVYTTWDSLKSIYEQLPQHQFTFARKSHLVNLEKIKFVRGNKLVMCSGTEIQLSRYARDEFMRAMHVYLEESR